MKRFHVSLTQEQMDKIDRLRSDHSRAEFIRQTIDAAWDTPMRSKQEQAEQAERFKDIEF